MKVIFDSDLLGDDLFALKALVQNKDIELLGITSVGRITSSLDRAKIAQVFLENTICKNVPIIPGVSRPLVQEPKNGCMFCNEQMNYLLRKWCSDYEYANKLYLDMSASEFIVSILKKEKGVVLLATGPLTNIALACSIHPQIVDNIKDIYLMGGVYKVQGNKSPVAESNIFNDRDAAAIVFSRFSNIHVIPLDVTLQFTIGEDDAVSLEDSFFRDVSLACCKSHLCRGQESVMPMHDYLAYLAMIDNDIVHYEYCNIDVDLYGDKTKGMLLLDFNKDGKHKIAVSVNKKKCFEHYFKDFMER